MRHLDEYSSKRISYRRMTVCDIPAVVRMRVQQLKDEGAQADFELKPYLTEFYERNLPDCIFHGLQCAVRKSWLPAECHLQRNLRIIKIQLERSVFYPVCIQWKSTEEEGLHGFY